IKACGGDLTALRADLEKFFEGNVAALPQDVDNDPQQTLAFQRVFQRAVMHVHSSGKTQMDSSKLLVAFYRERGSYAVYLLEKQGVTRLDVVRFISHGIAKVPQENGEHAFDETAPDAQHARGEGEAPVKNPLEAFATNLNKEAEDGRIDPLIGRDKEI